MKYVYLVKILLIFVLKSSVTWPLQGERNVVYEDRYQYHQPARDQEQEHQLSKMSRVCTFIAETCSKCTQLKACFWCSNNGAGRGSCYAADDLTAKERCVGEASTYWDKDPCRATRGYMPRNENVERSVLIKLILLLTKLRDSKNRHYSKPEVKTLLLKQRQLPNKESTKEISILSNSSMMDINHNNNISYNKIENDTTSQIFLRNNITANNSMSILKTNNTHNGTKNVTSNSSTMFHFTLQNNSTNYTVGMNLHTPCFGKNQSSCLMHRSCSWCNNGTCCWSSPSKSKERTVSPHTVLQHGGSMVCPAKKDCETCVSDITCYWCKSSCEAFPGQSYVNAQCQGEYHHKRCSHTIPIYVFALCIILVMFFLSVGYVCIRKCYYFQHKPVEVKLEERPILFKQKNGRTVYQITESEEEDEEELLRSGKNSYTPSKVGAAPNNPAVW